MAWRWASDPRRALIRQRVYALSVPGPERRRLRALAESEAVLLARNARDFAGIPGLEVEAAAAR